MKRTRRQRRITVSHHAFRKWSGFDQAAGSAKPKEWFWKGLERFANTTDSVDDYRALGKAFPSFWPLPLWEGRDVAWTSEAQPLFIFYRDLLRRFWTRDPAYVQKGSYVNLLFGAVRDLPLIAAGQVAPMSLESEPPIAELDRVIAPLRTSFPLLSGRNFPYVPVAWFLPDWNTGVVRFISQTDFQRAIWLLFGESWRAKVCPSCSAYFIAEKAAQLYCSIACSNAAHQSSALRWWRSKGARRRAALTKKSKPTKIAKERKHR